MKLYLDTSHFLALGILSDNYEWLHFEKHEKLQHSGDIHLKIHQALQAVGCEALDLASVIICNGPGSYTGIRLGEGIAQLFELAKVPVYSFHHYQVPKILGFEQGEWVCHAFKREVFTYKWNGPTESSDLIAASDWKPSESKLFGHQPEGPWQDFELQFTTDLIQARAKELLGHVEQNKLRQDSYYFRPLDKEFKRSVV